MICRLKCNLYSILYGSFLITAIVLAAISTRAMELHMLVMLRHRWLLLVLVAADSVVDGKFI